MPVNSCHFCIIECWILCRFGHSRTCSMLHFEGTRLMLIKTVIYRSSCLQDTIGRYHDCFDASHLPDYTLGKARTNRATCRVHGLARDRSDS